MNSDGIFFLGFSLGRGVDSLYVPPIIILATEVIKLSPLSRVGLGLRLGKTSQKISRGTFIIIFKFHVLGIHCVQEVLIKVDICSSLNPLSGICTE